MYTEKIDIESLSYMSSHEFRNGLAQNAKVVKVLQVVNHCYNCY